MSPSTIIRVAPWPKVSAKRKYKMLVAAVCKQRKQTSLCVTLEHLDPGQQGRIVECYLPLPCRPQGPTAEFFRGCGHEVEIDAKLNPRDCISRIIMVRFRVSESGGAEPSSFFPEDPDHGSKQQAIRQSVTGPTNAHAPGLLDR